jgi:hypothetical protein
MPRRVRDSTEKNYVIPLDIKVRLQDINNQATKCIQTAFKRKLQLEYP